MKTAICVIVTVEAIIIRMIQNMIQLARIRKERKTRDELSIKEIREKAYREGYEFGYDKGYSDGFGYKTK